MVQMHVKDSNLLLTLLSDDNSYVILLPETWAHSFRGAQCCYRHISVSLSPSLGVKRASSVFRYLFIGIRFRAPDFRIVIVSSSEGKLLKT